MKTSLRILSSFLALAALLLVTGCNTVSSSYTQAIGAPTFPPTNPSNVEVLRAPPTKPHVRLGEVTVEPFNHPTMAQIEGALQKEGAKLGANAVVIVYDQTQTVGAFVTGPWYGRTVSPIEGRVIKAVAIRYQ
jgi:hypothetical protein